MNRVIAVLLLAASTLFAQDKPVTPETAPAIAPVSDKEQIDVLRKHERMVQIQQVLQQAQVELNQLTEKMYADRKITPKDATLCFGPAPGPCAKVADFTLVFVAVEKPKAEDKPAGSPDPTVGEPIVKPTDKK